VGRSLVADAARYQALYDTLVTWLGGHGLAVTESQSPGCGPDVPGVDLSLVHERAGVVDVIEITADAGRLQIGELFQFTA
jgi:hypothetical protein